MNPCATTGEYPEWLKGYLENPNRPRARNADEVVYLPMSIHSIGKTDGTGHYPLLKILESFCTLNKDFEPYNIQFYLKGEIEIINRDLYYDHDNYSDGTRMMRTYNDPLTINTYITNNAPSNACGYYTPSEDAIVVRKPCLGISGHTWTHEVGHWLSLPHTFYGWEGRTYDANEETPAYLRINGKDTLYVENALGTNCTKAGDGFCDTPADYLSLGWSCNGNFQSIQVQKDPYGIDFRSDGSNFMCYSTDACQSKFSDEQMEAMHAYIEQSKAYYVNNSIPSNKVSDDPMTFEGPEDGEKVHYQSIKLQWKHHPNADHYLINISKFSFFVTIDYEFIVEGNSFTVPELPVDKTWYWRVKPFNAYDACAGFTEAGGFTTYDITDIDEINESNRLEIFPTLIGSGTAAINIDFEFSDLLNVEVDIYGATGQMLKQQHFANPGRSLQQVDIAGLTAGLYLLKISTEKGTLIKRIAIQ
ncbi:MAG: zinc-dependent metalloprotease [Saprospiraceae bacterium]|nr:zinc-dependent metalloprotease [Saprospiraceae bacterium]